MGAASLAGRRSSVTAYWSLLSILLLLPGSIDAAPRMTNFVHSVGFSFDYPSKWNVRRLDEGLALTPPDVGTDATGRPQEVVVIGFLGAGVADPFDPSFVDAFERHYRSLVPNLTRAGDMDWLQTSMGLGLLLPFKDRFGNPHRVYCAVRGDLGIFLAHVTGSDTARSRLTAVQQIFSSFSWTESMVDPALVRAWTGVHQEMEDQAPERWVFAQNGRLQHTERGGFYSSYGGVLNIVWDHGREESYLYKLSDRPEGGAQLELKGPGGEALQLH